MLARGRQTHGLVKRITSSSHNLRLLVRGIECDKVESFFRQGDHTASISDLAMNRAGAGVQNPMGVCGDRYQLDYFFTS